MLFEVKPTDPSVFLTVAAALDDGGLGGVAYSVAAVGVSLPRRCGAGTRGCRVETRLDPCFVEHPCTGTSAGAADRVSAPPGNARLPEAGVRDGLHLRVKPLRVERSSGPDTPPANRRNGRFADFRLETPVLRAVVLPNIENRAGERVSKPATSSLGTSQGSFNRWR